jgi:hypothetical protein
MKNLRLVNGKFVYDCESPVCKVPADKHAIALNDVMAAMEIVLAECYTARDIRTEAIRVAIQYMWQALYADSVSSMPSCPMNKKAPWRVEADALESKLALDSDEEPRASTADKKPKKEYLN